MRGHWLNRGVLAVGAVCIAVALVMPALVVAQDSDETLREQAIARAEELAPAPALKGTTLPLGEQVTHPLFIGVDDVTVPSYVGNPATNEWLQAFVGFQVWGAAFDEANNKMYFNNGSTLYEWPIGGAVTNLGTITDAGGAAQSMVGLAFYNGTLYATKNIANEAIWAIDTTTRIATVVIDYVDGDLDCGGFSADPNTGTFYCANDDSTPYGASLVIINPDATVTPVTAYPAGQTDIDGLAVGDNGFAYLVIDEPGSIFVYDLVGGAYAAPLTNPWTSAEIFSAGAWITEGGAQDPQNINVSPLSLNSTQPPDVVTQQVLSIGNTGDQALTWSILEELAPDFVDWFDNFDSYATGSQLHGQGGWKGWFNDPAGGALTSSAQAHSVPNSAAILGASDLVHEYAGYTAGQWIYTAWQYIPTEFTGTSYFILLNTYNDAGTGLNWSVQVNFDAATNLVTNDGVGGGTLPLIRGQWVELRNEINLDLDTQSFYYGGALLFSTSWTGGVSGGGALNIGAVDLFANGASVIYYDDFSLVAPGIPAACDLPSDVSWLSTAPSNGTTAGGASTPVQVGFDSTGLPLGTYNANLCVTSNDPDPGPGNGTDLVVVPVQLDVVAGTNPSISLNKTVGTEAGVCATTTTITVAPGTTVYYCYEVTNTGDVTLGLHTLADDVLGPIFSGLNYVLTPGSSVNTVTAGLSIPYVANSTTTNTGTWTAYNAGGPSVQATDTATVNVSTGNAAIELTKTVGTVPGVCAPTDTITVATGTDVYYCYVVENTGDVTFNFHDLVDDQLGTILNDLPYTLAPGAFSPEVIVPETVTAPVVNTATWTAMTDIGGYLVEPTTFSFVDISATGTALNLTDDSEANITSPFPFTLYGVTSTDLRVGNNGGILFNRTTGDLGTTNATLPNATIGLAILPFWDDIDADTGNVYWEVQGTAPNRVLIVEWYNRPHFSNIGSATFEALLYEGTNAIVFQYLDTDFGNASYNAGVSATVGINMDGSIALQYSYNQAVITDGLALRFEAVTPQTAVDDDTATVNISDPDINVTPASMVSSLLIGTTQTQVLSIGNTGSANLDWTLNEAQPNDAVYPPMANPAGPGDLTVAAEIHGEVPVDKPADWFAPPVAWDGPELVLYDNGPLVTHPGGGAGGADASVVQTALGMSVWGFGAQLTAGNRVADDVTIAGGNWTIDTITFFAYQTGSSTTSTITGVNLQIWDGPPNAGGTVVWGNTTTNVMTSTTWTNIYRVLDTTISDSTRPVMAVVAAVNTTLPAGTYWLDWQFDGTLASGPWAPPVTILGQTTTGNALQYTTTGWAALVDTGSLTPQGLPFIVEGTSSNCYMPEDIPWLSASPTAGTTAPGGTTPVDVTFDATATPIGTYEALLCVFSNDPDEPLVEVPVTMEVVIPVELMGISVE